LAACTRDITGSRTCDPASDRSIAPVVAEDGGGDAADTVGVADAVDLDDPQPARAALGFATELTEHKHVSPDTFAARSRHHSEREICEIVWLVSSNHLFNINNLGLGIGSVGFCELNRR
jgi:alkylhydroperoxidase family enzyme